MIVQFVNERLLGLLLVAEAERRISASPRLKTNQEAPSSQNIKEDLDQPPQSLLIEVIPHV